MTYPRHVTGIESALRPRTQPDAEERRNGRYHEMIHRIDSQQCGDRV